MHRNGYNFVNQFFLPCCSAHKCQLFACSDYNGLNILPMCVWGCINKILSCLLLCNPIPFYWFRLIRPFIIKLSTSNSSYILKENRLKLCMLAKKSHIVMAIWSSYCAFDLKDEKKRKKTVIKIVCVWRRSKF